MSDVDVRFQPPRHITSVKDVVNHESLANNRKDDSQDLPIIKQKSFKLDRTKPLPTSLQSDFIPEDILLALTLPSQAPELLGPVGRLKSVSKKSPAAAWSHPKRRDKLRHLVDNTVCVCGAGKDISFLYDVPKTDEKIEKPSVYDASAARLEGSGHSSKKQPIQLPDSLVPDEYRIVKNQGVLGLEYHDEPYTTSVEDHEKHLVVFPSLNPTSRYEVVQLKKTMDTMLNKAGLDDNLDRSIQPGETQLHRLLDLIKREQDIYNIVFHELIRQVSVDCLERGELLAAVRQRYSSLLCKVPRQIKSLHEEVMAQRALDRRLTEELMRFKHTVAVLTDELSLVKDHDEFVTAQSVTAQEELKRALAESEKNASLLAEYHDLYELQRKRLEIVVSQLTTEKELWSVAAYCLALKVTEEKNLQTAKRLQLFEKSWQKLANHFTITLANEDTEMLTVLQGHVDNWRDLIETFNFNLKQREEVMAHKLTHMLEEICEFRDHFAAAHLYLAKVNSLSNVPDDNKLADLVRRLKSWEELVQTEVGKYGGEGLLSMQEDLQRIRVEMDGWTEAALKVFSRHSALDGSKYPDHETMLYLNDSVYELLGQYQVRLVGDNGVATRLISLCNILEIWAVKSNTALVGSGVISENDWLRLYDLLGAWSNSLTDVIALVGTSHKEDDLTDKDHTPVEYAEVVKMTQRWASSTTSGIDSEDTKLTEQVATLHTDMTKWMIQLLLRIAPDKEGTSREAAQMALLGSLSVRELKETAMTLFNKLYLFTNYIVHLGKNGFHNKPRRNAVENTDSVQCCNYIVKEAMQTKIDNREENPDKECQELMLMKTDCDDWIQIAILLMLELSGEKLIFEPKTTSHLDKEAVDPVLWPKTTDSITSMTSKPQSRSSVDVTPSVSRQSSAASSVPHDARKPPISSETDRRPVTAPGETLIEVTEQPTDHAVGVEQPADHAVGVEQPADHVVGVEHPADQAVSGEQPADHTVGGEQPADHAVGGEQPAKQAVNEEQPVDHAVGGEQPVDQTVGMEQPADHAVGVEQPADHTVGGEQPADHAMGGVQPADHAVSGEQPVDLAAAGQGTDDTLPTVETDQPSAEVQVHQEGMVQWLSQDKNTYFKPLEQDPNEAPPVTDYTISEPVRETPDTTKAYEALAAIDRLQQQVVKAETRAQESEDNARALNEELHRAMEKIRALERQLGDGHAEDVTVSHGIDVEKVHVAKPEGVRGTRTSSAATKSEKLDDMSTSQKASVPSPLSKSAKRAKSPKKK